MGKRLLPVLCCVCLFATAASAQAGKSNSTKTPKAVLAAYIDAWNRRDYAAFDRLLAPAGTHEDIAEGVFAKGPAQAKDFMRDVLKQEPDFVWKATRFVESGNLVAAEWTWTATYTGDSPNGPVKAKRITGRGACVARVENGRIVQITDYYDNASFFPKAAAR